MRRLAMVVSACCMAVATEVSFTNYNGSSGPIKIPIYTLGHCRFRCVTPAGWRADVRRSGHEVVRFTPPGTSAVFIAIFATAVSLASHELQAWRIPDLKRELCAGRTFSIQEDSCGIWDKTFCWNVRGIATNAPIGGTRMPTSIEQHSYCIRNGYLLQLMLSEPCQDGARYADAFAMIKMTFRSMINEVNWAPLDMRHEPMPNATVP